MENTPLKASRQLPLRIPYRRGPLFNEKALKGALQVRHPFGVIHMPCRNAP